MRNGAGWEDLLAPCIRCGLCLPSCPTYRLTPRERANPRGRIALMRAVAAGEMADDDAGFAEAMYYCVGCRACETACPAGVEFGRLLEGARERVEEARAPGRPTGVWRDWLLERVLPHPHRLRLAARLLRLYQRTLGRFGAWRRWLARHRPGLARALESAPDVPPQGRRWRLPARMEPRPLEARGSRARQRGKVALHPGCVQAVLLPEVNGDTVRVLTHNAWLVVVPSGFRCCGALHAHHGRVQRARDLARINIAAFEEAEVEALVSNAAGCGAHFKNYGHLLADDPEWAARAERFAGAVVDVSEHLAREGMRRPARPFSLRATYDDPCHLIHGQRVARAPRLVLRAIPGLQLEPLAESTTCCGSAGIYNLTHPAAADALRSRKIERIAATGAEIVLTGNPGCLLQISAGLAAAGSTVRALHPMSLLRVAYELPPLLPR